MPRAFCPECAAEVPVDEEGRCFLGHQVPEAAASGATPSSRPDVRDAVDEPEPWVANVTAEGAEAPEDEAVGDTTAPAGRATPMEEATPSSGPEAGTPRVGEVPDPTAEGEEVELDLDTLEQAVAEMGLTAEQDDGGDEDAFAVFEEEPSDGREEDRAAEEPEVEVHEGAVADVLETQGASPRPAGTRPEPEPAPDPEPEPEPEPEPAPEPAVERQPETEPQPEQHETPDEPDEWAAFDAPAEPEATEEGSGEEEPGDEPEEPEDAEPVDTANFLARPKGKRRGLFGR